VSSAYIKPCINVLLINGADSDIDTLASRFTRRIEGEKAIDFDALVPQPSEYASRVIAELDEVPGEIYNWRERFWGSHLPWGLRLIVERDFKETAILTFETPRRPPLPWLRHLTVEFRWLLFELSWLAPETGYWQTARIGGTGGRIETQGFALYTPGANTEPDDREWQRMEVSASKVTGKRMDWDWLYQNIAGTEIDEDFVLLMARQVEVPELWQLRQQTRVLREQLLLDVATLRAEFVRAKWKTVRRKRHRETSHLLGWAPDTRWRRELKELRKQDPEATVDNLQLVQPEIGEAVHRLIRSSVLEAGNIQYLPWPTSRSQPLPSDVQQSDE
jgi:hypothetical protein